MREKRPRVERLLRRARAAISFLAISSRSVGAVLLPIGILAIGSLGAAVVPWLDLEEMTRRAEVIGLGTVEKVESAWTADGRMILTRTTIELERAIKGGPRKQVVIEIPGGKVGDQMMVASGAPVFSKGERIVVFLQRPSAAPVQSGAAITPFGVVGWNLGKMPVRHDPHTGRDLVHAPATSGATYLTPGGRPVDPSRHVRAPAELRQFLQRIEDLITTGEQESTP